MLIKLCYLFLLGTQIDFICQVSPADLWDHVTKLRSENVLEMTYTASKPRPSTALLLFFLLLLRYG